MLMLTVLVLDVMVLKIIGEQHLGGMLLASVKSPLYHKAFMNLHGLHAHLFLHSFHAPFLH